MENSLSALIMVVYNHLPSFESLTLALNSVDYVLLMDNGSSPPVLEAMESFASPWNGRCIVLRNGSNLGISRAYNRAFQILRDIGVHWIFMADHDALFSTDYFRKSRQVWSMASESCSPGVVVPIVADDPSIMGSALGLDRPYSMVSSTITSGIMTNMDVIDSVNGFDERFFVEAADLDLTTRIRNAGYSLIRYNRVDIIQTFEVPVSSVGEIQKVLNSVITFRSVVRIKINNCNIFRTHLSRYNDARRRDLMRNFRTIFNDGNVGSIFTAMVILINLTEMLAVTLVGSHSRRKQIKAEYGIINVNQ